jgi:hypothetical protein
MNTMQRSNTSTLRSEEMISPVSVPGHSASLVNIGISVRDVADRIRVRQRNQTDAMIENGRDLMEMKNHLGDELFHAWLQSQCQISEHLARQYMSFAVCLDDNINSVRDMPIEVLYKLTAPRTPYWVWQIVFRCLKRGQCLSLGELNQLIRERQQAEKA